MGIASVRDCERGLLIVLKSDFLRQHDVADWKLPFRTEAPSDRTHAMFVELVDIHLMCSADAIALAAVAARHFEVPMNIHIARAEPGIAIASAGQALLVQGARPREARGMPQHQSAYQDGQK